MGRRATESIGSVTRSVDRQCYTNFVPSCDDRRRCLAVGGGHSVVAVASWGCLDPHRVTASGPGEQSQECTLGVHGASVLRNSRVRTAGACRPRRRHGTRTPVAESGSPSCRVAPWRGPTHGHAVGFGEHAALRPRVRRDSRIMPDNDARSSGYWCGRKLVVRRLSLGV